MGFRHEHQRPDRDSYIKIFEENITLGSFSQFAKARGTQTLGYGYNFASIMHYKDTAFGINGSVTIASRQPGIPFGIAQELSPLDAIKANALYRCGK